jgi:diguanylate cyclase (GGDEF)-like protein
MGYAPDQLVGRSLGEFTDLKGTPRPGVVVELSVTCQDGSARWAEMSTAALPDGSDGAALVCVLRDITDRKRLEKDLHHLATTDGLTGALNRRHFVELGQRELAQAVRRFCPVTLLLLDVDHFKQINDRHGHRVGDEVLRQVVQAGRRSLRAEDAFGRVGGDEFAVLLPATASPQAVQIAERLRRTYEALAVPLPEGGTVRFTVSIGVAQWRPEQATIEDMIHRADCALYEAKRGGRNCVRTDDACSGA